MKNKDKIKYQTREGRHRRIRTKIFGTIKKPRLSVFRSLRHLFVQLIDDDKGVTLVNVSDQELKTAGSKKVDLAREVGKLIARKALEKGVKEVVFDRGGYKYHGRVKAVAEGAREGGLKF